MELYLRWYVIYCYFFYFENGHVVMYKMFYAYKMCAKAGRGEESCLLLSNLDRAYVCAHCAVLSSFHYV